MQPACESFFPNQLADFTNHCIGGGLKPGEIRNERENDAALKLFHDSPICLGAKKTSNATWSWLSDGTVFYENDANVNEVYANMKFTFLKAPSGSDDEICLLMQESGQWTRDRCDAGNMTYVLCVA